MTHSTLITIDNEDYAFLENGIIHINIEKLWNENPHVEWFVEEFLTSYTHEMLHLVLYEEDCQGPALGEEKVIRGILGEEWNDKLEWIYEGEEA